MYSLILSKLTKWWKLVLGLGIALIPVITYFFGRKDGGNVQKVERMQSALKSEKARADFHKKVGGLNNEAQSNKPVDKSSLVDRLRNNGL
jgi:hypothetical protein